jgi:hypothetical protein
MFVNGKNYWKSHQRGDEQKRSIFIADENGNIREEPVIHRDSKRGEKTCSIVFSQTTRESNRILVTIGGQISSSSGGGKLSYVNKFGIVVPVLEENPENKMQPKKFGERWDVPPPERCDCRNPSSPPIVFVVRKEGRNYGRYFYRCPDWNSSSGCNWMIWVDVWEKNNRNRLATQIGNGDQMFDEGAEEPRSQIRGSEIPHSHIREDLEEPSRSHYYVSRTTRPPVDNGHNGLKEDRSMYRVSSVLPAENTRVSWTNDNRGYNQGGLCSVLVCVTIFWKGNNGISQHFNFA